MNETSPNNLYLVSFVRSGSQLGLFQATSEDQAVELARQDAGYASLATAAGAFDGDVVEYRDAFDVQQVKLDGYIACLNGEVLGWGETKESALNYVCAHTDRDGDEEWDDGDYEVYPCAADVADAFRCNETTPLKLEIVSSVAGL